MTAIEPVGMTKASTMKARKTKAKMKATTIDSSVSAIPSMVGLEPDEVGSADLSEAAVMPIFRPGALVGLRCIGYAGRSGVVRAGGEIR